MRSRLVGGTHNEEEVEHCGMPFIKMMEKVRRPVYAYSRYRVGDEIIAEKFKTETYVLRQFAFRHQGLWCKTEAYVLEGISDDEAARMLNTRDTQQDW